MLPTQESRAKTLSFTTSFTLSVTGNFFSLFHLHFSVFNWNASVMEASQVDNVKIYWFRIFFSMIKIFVILQAFCFNAKNERKKLVFFKSYAVLGSPRFHFNTFLFKNDSKQKTHFVSYM